VIEAQFWSLGDIMKKWIQVLVGFVVGLFFAGWLIQQNPRPAISVFLQTPLNWVFNYIESFHIYPRESLAGLAIGIPLWFIYWGSLGALVSVLLRLLFFAFRKLRNHDDA
jgi:hypothetical protein